VVAAIIALHQRFGTGQVNFGVEPLANCVIGVADQQVSKILSPDFSIRLSPQALGHFNLESLGLIFNDVIAQDMLPEVVGGFEIADKGGEINAGQQSRLCFSASARFKRNLLKASTSGLRLTLWRGFE
jgi:hypothetical protein